MGLTERRATKTKERDAVKGRAIAKEKESLG